VFPAPSRKISFPMPKMGEFPIFGIWTD